MKLLGVLLVAAAVAAAVVLARTVGGSSSDPSDEPVNELAATWSPDGRSLVFDHPHDGDTEIYVEMNEGTVTRLTSNGDSDYFPSWSPDGRRIAFVSDRDGRGAQVYVMNRDGSGQERLTGADDGVAGLPAWSPDSKRIAYTELDCESDVCTGTIKILRLADDETTTVERGDFFDMRGPSFARDGTLAFASVIGDPGISVATPDGRRRRVTRVDPGAGWPVWSPDGRRLAYQCGYAVCTVSRDGRTQKILVPASAERPAWSPDGRRIVYACGKDPVLPSSAKAGALCVFSVDDRAIRRIRFSWPK